MNKPQINHMIAYLQRMGVTLNNLEPRSVEAEYFRNIYKVQPREQVLSKVRMPAGKVTEDFRRGA